VDEEVAGAVDAVLTFAELERWVEEAQPKPEPMVDPETGRAVTARLFPLEGGLLRTARLNTDVLSADTVVATGFEACEEALDAIRAGVLQARMVELMACPSGCINGPAIPKGESVFVRKQKILRFARQTDSSPVDGQGIPLARAYHDESLRLSPIPTGIIQDLLARIEKYSEADELNCSACGYNTCREKAQATYWGMAEISMCVPYMRRRAESLANLVMDVVPSAVVVLDYQLRIQEASPSAEKLLGRRQRYRDDLIVKEFIVPVPRSNLIVGIVEDVTREEMQQAELTHIREATIERAEEVIAKQMRVAHEIASLLGETTAETKVQLSRMIEVIRGPDGREKPAKEL
jgi:PAS domain-containing protein